jgi:hypothetical protein
MNRSVNCYRTGGTEEEDAAFAGTVVSRTAWDYPWIWGEVF